MDFGLEGVALVGLQGGMGLLEHPQEPPDVDQPSIWRQPLLNALLQIPGFRTLCLAQGLLGAWSMKPTQLLVANLPQLVSKIAARKLTDEPPGRASIGLRDDGHGFQTTGLKEYPPAFCAALGSAFADQMTRLNTSDSVQLSAEFQTVCKAMLCTNYGEHIGQDYAT